MVGLLGAAGMYLLVQSKIKKAKKFRRDAEYGTARWGTKEDIKPFADPKFQNNVILTGTEFLTMNTRPKNPANARNLNACVIGSSGSGKTRFWLTPQLLQAHSSYVCVDPKGGTLDQCGHFLQRQGYKVRVFNSIDFSRSMHYNPLAYIKTESDVLKFVTALIANTKGDGKEGDEFWTKAETLLYCALVSYIVFEGPEEERNLNTLVEMINSMEVREDDETFKNAVDYMFDGLEKRNPQHFAVRQYKKYKLASGKTAKSILISCGARLKGAIVQYAKSRPVFEQYKATKYSRKFLAEHESEIELYRAAQANMKRLLNGAKLPKMETLKEESRKLAAKKNKLYGEYQKVRRDMQELVTIKANIDCLLGYNEPGRKQEKER